MKKISIINACTALGVHVNGTELGPEILTKDLQQSNIVHTYTLKNNNHKNDDDPRVSKNAHSDINDFVSEFNRLLLSMHDLDFGESMSYDELKIYNKKMHDLVVAVKALDTKNEKRNLNQINKFNEDLYNTVCNAISDDSFPITVGGDHIIAIASCLASIKKHQNLGIIWFDSHADYNTYQTSVTGNLHGLPLAVATHYEKSMLADFHDGPFYDPKHTVIVGGKDRGVSQEELEEFLKNSTVENIICLPKTGEFIYHALKNVANKQLFMVENLQEAVKIAKEVTREETICVLSPAASSYGYFKNFEERGNLFKKFVLENIKNEK